MVTPNTGLQNGKFKTGNASHWIKQSPDGASLIQATHAHVIEARSEVAAIHTSQGSCDFAQDDQRWVPVIAVTTPDGSALQ
ncbi:MAG: hypothetical protein FWH56_12330 [Betaproteobacteria bacterium]|nr:hypothetical protein [Betaproteobacteria bacterium]